MARSGLRLAADSVRFNGATFEPFGLSAIEGVIGSGVRAVYSHSRGNLWLGAFREEVLKVGRESAQRFSVSQGVPAAQFTSFAEEREGTVRLAFGGHIFAVHGDRLREVEIPDRVGSGGRASLVRDAAGLVWCALNGRIGALQAGKLEQRFRLEGRDLTLAAARAGGLWASAGSRLYRITGDDPPVERIALPDGARPSPCSKTQVARSGWGPARMDCCALTVRPSQPWTGHIAISARSSRTARATSGRERSAAV